MHFGSLPKLCTLLCTKKNIYIIKFQKTLSYFCLKPHDSSRIRKHSIMLTSSFTKKLVSSA